MLNGKRHGRGTKTWPNGDKYDGEWQFDQKDGRGTLSSEAEACYEGEWRSGAKHGKGKVTFACGDEYDGEWQGDRAHGKGVFRKKNGNVYAGSYYQDRCHGFGTLTFTNGDRFEGMWRGGVKSGQGTITWATGRKFTGRFAEDCPVVGELTEDDGKVYRVTYGGGVKFSQGAQPQTRELVCTDAPAGKEHGILAPSLNADATKMRADNGSLAGGGAGAATGLVEAGRDESGPVTGPAGAGAGRAGQGHVQHVGGSAAGPMVSAPADWDPFAEISALVKRDEANRDWDPFGAIQPAAAPAAGGLFGEGHATSPLASPMQAAAGAATGGRRTAPVETVPGPSPPMVTRPSQISGGALPSGFAGMNSGSVGSWQAVVDLAHMRAGGGGKGGKGLPSTAARVALPADYLASEVWAPVELVCPLTREVLLHPVRHCDGVTYDRDALLLWLAEHPSCSSPCRRPPPHAETGGGGRVEPEDDVQMQERLRKWHRSREWSIPPCSIELHQHEILGKGAWGVVHLATLSRTPAHAAVAAGSARGGERTG